MNERGTDVTSNRISFSSLRAPERGRKGEREEEIFRANYRFITSTRHFASDLISSHLGWRILNASMRIKIENFLHTNLDLTHLSKITLIIPPVCTAQWHDWTSSEFRTRASGEEVRRWVISQPKIPRPLERRENENDKRLSCRYRRGAPRESRGGVRVESGVRVRLGARDEGRIRDV